MVKTEKKVDKKPRWDKIRNRAKIIKEVLKDPTQSERDIAKKVWNSPSTVHEHIKDLPSSSKNEHISKVIENDAKIVTLWQRILLQRMQLAEEDPKYLATRDIITATDLSGKRHMLLNWPVTDDKWWFTLEWMSKEELLRIATS